MTVLICNECNKPIHNILNDSIFCHCQPERSKREDFEKLTEEFLETFFSDRGGNWETENGYILGIEEYSLWLNQRCGALNSMET
jgi:hypothetical protein